MKETEAKGGLAVIAAVLSYLAGCFSEILVVLGLLMMLDYVLGLCAAIANGQPLSIQKGWRGVLKKSGYIACVGVAFIADYCVMWTSGQMHFAINTNGSLGVVTCLYLIGTEGISILKHLSEIGVPVPRFLETTFGQISEGREQNDKNIH